MNSDDLAMRAAREISRELQDVYLPVLTWRDACAAIIRRVVVEPMVRKAEDDLKKRIAGWPI